MSDIKRERYGLDVERDDQERLSPEDMATQREAEFRADALAVQRLNAASQAQPRRGWCSNCDERCSPFAVYCDEDCKADHEARVRASARQRRWLG